MMHICGERGYIHNVCMVPKQGCDLRCISLRESKIGFVNLKESENGFCISVLNRSI